MDALSVDFPLFPPLQPNRSGMLAVSELHTLYWEECGNPDGIPVIFLHGGPGGGISPKHRQFFHPQHYRIILFDQRGAGKSTPLGEWRENTTQLLIDDIEALRRMLGIEQWLVFGGSWGATLALAYGQAHPQRCSDLSCAASFFARRMKSTGSCMGWADFSRRRTMLSSRRFRRKNGRICCARISSGCLVTMPKRRCRRRATGVVTKVAVCSCIRRKEMIEAFSDDVVALGIGRLEAHYFLHGGFFEEDQLIRDIDVFVICPR
jgi:proline iminopeptidase